jgi:hypothetical protein
VLGCDTCIDGGAGRGGGSAADVRVYVTVVVAACSTAGMRKAGVWEVRGGWRRQGVNVQQRPLRRNGGVSTACMCKTYRRAHHACSRSRSYLALGLPLCNRHAAHQGAQGCQEGRQNGHVLDAGKVQEVHRLRNGARLNSPSAHTREASRPWHARGGFEPVPRCSGWQRKSNGVVPRLLSCAMTGRRLECTHRPSMVRPLLRLPPTHKLTLGAGWRFPPTKLAWRWKGQRQSPRSRGEGNGGPTNPKPS